MTVRPASDWSVRPAVPGLVSALARRPATRIWLVLVTATTLSWWLGDGHGPRRIATVGVILVAMLKVFLVGQYFMELRDAPWLLRGIFEAFCVVLLMLLSTTYLLA